MAHRIPLQGLPGGVPLVGQNAQPQNQVVIMDAVDDRGNPIKVQYPTVAVSVISDQVLGQIVQSTVATALAELEKRGAIPGDPDRAVAAINLIEAAIADYGNDLPICAKVVGEILEQYHNAGSKTEPTS